MHSDCLWSGLQGLFIWNCDLCLQWVYMIRSRGVVDWWRILVTKGVPCHTSETDLHHSVKFFSWQRIVWSQSHWPMKGHHALRKVKGCLGMEVKHAPHPRTTEKFLFVTKCVNLDRKFVTYGSTFIAKRANFDGKFAMYDSIHSRHLELPPRSKKKKMCDCIFI